MVLFCVFLNFKTASKQSVNDWVMQLLTFAKVVLQEPDLPCVLNLFQSSDQVVVGAFLEPLDEPLGVVQDEDLCTHLSLSPQLFKLCDIGSHSFHS